MIMQNLKNMIKKDISTYLSIILLLFSITLKAQDIDKDVIVTKDFVPVIHDADKIDLSPEISDTIKIKPSFSYRIFPIPVKTQFELRPIKPAKLVGIPISELNRYYIKAGIGNHHLPLFEAYANNLRSDKYSVGAALNIEKQEGKIKLENNQKITGANSYIHINTFGKFFLGNFNIENTAGIELTGAHYYGLNPDTVYNSLPGAKDIKHNHGSVYFKGKIYSVTNNTGYEYNASFFEEYTWDRDEYHENYIGLNLENKIKLSLFDLYINGDFDFINNNLSGDTLNKLSFVTIRPYISNTNGEFRYKLGMSLTVENGEGNNTSLFPVASLEYSLAEEVLTTFFTLDGKINKNRYKEILDDNPFINPGSNPYSSKEQLNVVAGFKGNINKSVSYFITGGLQSIKNQYFYAIDSVGIYDNHFKLIYDDLDITSVSGGMFFNINNKLDIELSGSSYRYLTGEEEKAWHMPLWDLKTDIKYNIQEKIFIQSDLNIIGTRYAKSINDETIELKPFASLDVQIDYNFSKLLSAFITIKNLNAARYTLWNQYPYYKTMVIIGGVYKF